jgi:hypothetical protein
VYTMSMGRGPGGRDRVVPDGSVSATHRVDPPVVTAITDRRFLVAYLGPDAGSSPSATGRGWMRPAGS